MKSKASFSNGYMIALTATVLWSFTGILISYLSKTFGLPALVLAFWRDLSVSLGLVAAFLVISPARFRLAREFWGFTVIYGLTLAVFNSLWTLSVEYNGASVATVLAFSSPAFTAILSRWVFKEKIYGAKLISIFLSIAGTVLVSGAYNPAVWQINPLGIGFGLSTGLFFAIYNLLGKSASDKAIDSWTALLYTFASATVFLFLFNVGIHAIAGTNLWTNLFWLKNSTLGWSVLIFLGVVPTVGGFGLYTLSLRSLPPTVANLIATLEPILTAIWAYFLLNEMLEPIQMLGGALIFAGVILLRLKERQTGEFMSDAGDQA